MSDVDSSTSERIGETLAEVEGVGDVSIIAEENGNYQVSMLNGNIVSTTESGLSDMENIDWTTYTVGNNWSSPPWEPDPDPQPSPLDPDPNDNIGTLTTPQTRTVKSKISYICPECDGQFSSWLRESGSITEDDTYMCPFCKTERGNYGDDVEPTIEEAVEVVREKLEEEEDAQWFAELLGIVGDDQ